VTLAPRHTLRAILVETQGLYVAYMFMSNWLTVLLLGLAVGQSGAPEHRHGVSRIWAPALIWILAWPLAMIFDGWKRTFPFMSLGDGNTAGCHARALTGCVARVRQLHTGCVQGH
jgi:hypothetical protein